jgi:hypothetical protein
MLLRLKTFERQLSKFFFGKAFVPAQRTRMDQPRRLQGIKNDRLSGSKRWHDQIKKRSEIGSFSILKATRGIGNLWLASTMSAPSAAPHRISEKK